MRPARTAERTERVEASDPRFVDAAIVITDGGRYFLHFKDQYAPYNPETNWMEDERPALASDTIGYGARAIGKSLSIAVVDAEDRPMGLLGWDDAVRFALAHGANDPCWYAPAVAATRPGYAITPLSGFPPLAPFATGLVRTVRDVAEAMLRALPGLGDQDDGLQRWIDDGCVTPSDLLRAIFG